MHCYSLETKSRRVAKVKDMKVAGYGRYDDVADEKDVIRMSA
jgi:hypothetical protein